MEKPPIIDSFDCSTCDTEPEGCPGCGSSAKEAQRDADVEWYAKEIGIALSAMTNPKTKLGATVLQHTEEAFAQVR
jgi:hypothetical protein